MKKTKAIADHYGKEHQTIKAMEELAELIQALAKGDLDNIKEEILAKGEQSSFEAFTYGAKFKGKLTPKRVKGGVVLCKTEFTIEV